jgi:hypothetical protein
MVPHLIANETCWLITPKQMGCEWTINNKHFRSSVWNSNGELISAGFPKFTNWGEKPDVFPVPTTLSGSTVVEKLDGSLLVVSKYKGEFIIRTRGTVVATKMEKNGHEIELFKKKFPKVFEFQPIGENWEFSLLFEWTSPLNQIVVNYGDEPRFKLIGFVSHSDYRLGIQEWLDVLAKQFDCERPRVYSFKKIDTMIADVSSWKNLEGVCVYSNHGQVIHKIKGSDYLMKHRFKENATLENTVDLFVSFRYPPFQQFEQQLINQFDYECYQMVRGYASMVCDAYKQVCEIKEGMVRFVTDNLRGMSRKDAAAKIISAYGNTNRAAFVFTLLDGKDLNADQLKKLLRQCLKK